MKETRDPVDVTFGASLRARRTALGMSLEELGRRIGVTYQQVQKYETGANRVSISAAARIAKAFGCPLAVLMKPIDDMERDPAPASPSPSALGLVDRPLGSVDRLPRHIREPLVALAAAVSSEQASLNPRPAAETPALAH